MTNGNARSPLALLFTAAAIAAATALFACASRAPAPKPVATSKIVPRANERVVDQVVILVDTSGSIDEYEQFPEQRALVESLVGAMPDGSYEVGVIAFGGPKRQVYDAAFDRGALDTYAENLDYLSDGTPLDAVLKEVGHRLEGKHSKASLIVITDGRPSDNIGRDVSPDRSLEAARALAAGYGGSLCIHTVQIGDDPEGAAFLANLAAVTRCGSMRSERTLADAASVEGFTRTALLTALPQVSAAPPTADDDRDGVRNADDQCPNTPAAAPVDARGCWKVPPLHFAFDSATFAPKTQELIQSEIVPVLKRNPDVRVRVAGYTDSSGDPAYNEQLSTRRAQAVRQALISDGIEPARLDAKGFGAADPIESNDTAAGRKANRRTEIQVLD